ncbi:MAG: NlpC/P60 family protein [Actinobacteria bacterium]|nr:MAG: NlpC/P60 family protein [Actinomycetota bacterium]
MADTTHARQAPGRRRRLPSRVQLIATSAAGLAALALVLILTAGGGSRPARARPGAHAPARSARGATAATGASAAPRAASASTSSSGHPVEVADPEESRSFPAPDSARRRSAAAPAKAGEAIVAAGAPSDAEVREELAQMQAVERAARRKAQLRLQAVPGGGSIGGNGTIPIPAGVPEVVQRVIAGANAIADFPYVFGGGHGSFVDSAYDCSGSVSYALAAGGLLSAPVTSGELERWGAPGPGRYITVFANAGHTYMYVDGVRYDTSGRSGIYASRWQVAARDNSGFAARHWPGF